MDIRLFKMVTGEEVIACIVAHSQSVITVENATTMRVGPNGAPFFAPWPELAAEGQQVSFRHAALLCDPLMVHEEIERALSTAITGIQLPPTTGKILMG